MTTAMFESLHAELPKRKEIAEYLDTLFFECNKDKPFHILVIVDDVKHFFNVSNEAAALKLKEGHRTGHLNTATYLESLTHFSVFDLFLARRVKRVDGNTWASADGSVAGALAVRPKVSLRKLNEAMVSVKILTELNFPPEQIKEECKHKWEIPVLDLAIERVKSAMQQLHA